MDKTLISGREPIYSEPEKGPDDLASPRSELGWAWMLWRERRLLFASMAYTFVFAVVVALLIPVQYESITRLLPGENSKMSSSASMMSMLASKATESGGGSGSLDISGLLGTKTPGAFYVAILESRTVQDQLIHRFDLRKVYGMRYYETTRKKLASRTKIAEDRKSGVITVTVADRSPERAAAMARAYAEEVNRLSAELNTSEAHRERVFVEERLKETKQELDTADRELSEFSSKYSAIDIKEQGKAMVGAAATLQGELIAAESQLRGLEQIYSDSNVRVRSLRARVGELKNQLQKIGGEYVPPGGPATSKEEMYPPIRSLPALGYRYAAYYRRAKVAETVFELLTKQYEIAKIQEAKELPVMLAMDPAEVPERKAFPPRTLIVGLSLFASLVLASCWIIGRKRWHEVEHTDTRKQLALEVREELASTLRWVRLRTSRVWRSKEKDPSPPPVNFRDPLP